MKFVRLLLIAITCSVSISAQDTPFTLNVDVRLVSLDARVSDADGRAVTNLARNDFQIYEDGALQKIQNFSPVDTPYSVLMLLDCSDSTHDQWPFLMDGMQRFTRILRPQDRLSIAAFGGKVQVLVDWDPSRTNPLSLGASNATCQGTNFYSAIKWTASHLQTVPGRRGAIVLTDGVDALQRILRTGTVMVANTGGQRVVDAEDDSAFKATLRDVRQGGTPFYFVAIDTDLNPGPDFSPTRIYNMQQARARMQQLAEATGGRIVFPKKPKDLVPMFEQIVRELGTSYSLGYVPPSADSGKYHRVEIRTLDKGLKVSQSREGYTAP